MTVFVAAGAVLVMLVVVLVRVVMSASARLFVGMMVLVTAVTRLLVGMVMLVTASTRLLVGVMMFVAAVTSAFVGMLVHVAASLFVGMRMFMVMLVAAGACRAVFMRFFSHCFRHVSSPPNI